jgi:predicted nucleic acid-binding protein
VIAYVDSSVLLAAIFDEVKSEFARQLLKNGGTFINSWLTQVEVRRNIARFKAAEVASIVKQEFVQQFRQMLVATIDEKDWSLAAEIGESTLLKSLDALHLAVASNLELQNLTFLTFDKRQASVARQLGFSVVGA